MNNSKSKGIALVGVMSAVVFVLLLLETQVFVLILPVSPCFFSLPIAISLCLYADWKKMFLGGGIFGVCSLILAFFFPPLIAFANPCISLIPRIILGIAAFGVYRGVSALFAKSQNKFLNRVLPLSLAGAVGAITNTVLVVSALTIFRFTGIENALAIIVSVNALIEIICSIILVPIIVLAIKRYYHTDRINENSHGENHSGGEPFENKENG